MGPAGAADFRVSDDAKIPACYGCGSEIPMDDENRPWQLPALAREGIYHVLCEKCCAVLNSVAVFRLVTRCVNEAVAGVKESSAESSS